MASTAEANTSRTPGSQASPTNSLITPKRSPSSPLRSGTPAGSLRPMLVESSGSHAGDEIEERGRVTHVAGERADLVQRAGEGHQSVAADRSVGGLESHHAAERGRLPDGTPGVGAQSPGRLAGGDAGGGAATGAARDPVEVPGVSRGLEGGVLGGAAHGELVHVELAEEDQACGSQLGDDGGVIGRDVAFEDARAARGLHPLHGEDVLEADRHSLPGKPFRQGLGIHRAAAAMAPASSTRRYDCTCPSTSAMRSR